ncbi:tRNA glutamyl-Q(34) synthetase GluQRS [Acidomonas methanolica]|uniref:Glutamyl-tRNA synthetase n=2 Tax=Acidomonas methanolica TaxID=437 RepID=A0A023D5E6_ACIMT|nr:tRNA glutamyl-Q(34) synthetase GluQRS [Acidomonas methanolica]MBU2653247.1 tRNA glutamyl-Q(34) synthetase GluQRS [Acidomonas methanolica]GAJ29000.1 glutamyl-tRNA synthetase [Acidomonas methanolica NBRC 104435]GBQ50930.1 glutamyl-tRNA synthetase [Acidomonas methanolica]GEK97630.1 tRNA glutamyl-Q(34) synthetase GluQRS [Acidomonas methanolica NBRC 104435]
MMTDPRTRFAPSPTGYLHLGHVVSALHARDMAGRDGFLLRIEDIDSRRCLPRYDAALIEDLDWLGLRPEAPPRRQSEHLPAYRAVLAGLRERGLVYPCTCTRQEIAAASPGIAPDGGLLYPGTCRNRSLRTRDTPAWRLDMARALDVIGGEPGWTEIRPDGSTHRVERRAADFGDVVLGRKESGVSYHLCVAHDDAIQNIDIVTRGRDLFDVTAVHRVLQALLGYRAPLYAHHPLLIGVDGKKLSKSEGAASVRDARARGESAASVLDRARAALEAASYSEG